MTLCGWDHSAISHLNHHWPPPYLMVGWWHSTKLTSPNVNMSIRLWSIINIDLSDRMIDILKLFLCPILCSQNQLLHMKALHAVTNDFGRATELEFWTACCLLQIVFNDTDSCRRVFISDVICAAVALCFLASVCFNPLLSLSARFDFWQLLCLASFHCSQHSTSNTNKGSRFGY